VTLEAGAIVTARLYYRRVEDGVLGDIVPIPGNVVTVDDESGNYAKLCYMILARLQSVNYAFYAKASVAQPNSKWLVMLVVKYMLALTNYWYYYERIVLLY
jgi:hypothetical protein